MRALTMDELDFVSGGWIGPPPPPYIYTIPPATPTPPSTYQPPGETNNTDYMAAMYRGMPSWIKGNNDIWATQNKALELLNDASIIKKPGYKVGDTTYLEMVDQYGNEYQIMDVKSDGWNERVRMLSGGALFQWSPTIGTNKWSWQEVK